MESSLSLHESDAVQQAWIVIVLSDEQRETFERIAARWIAPDVQETGPSPG
jgi:hypothetical protein